MSMRISGLASGMDIDQLVKDMMRPMQMRIDKVTQQKTVGEWTQEAYNDINATLARFVLDRTADFGSTLSTVSGTIRSADRLTWLKAASSSDTSIIEVTAGATAVEGSFSINVQRLAANWAAASADALPALGTNPDGSTMTDNLLNQFSLDPSAVIDFTVTTNSGAIRVTNDQSATEVEGVKLVKIGLETASLSQVAKELNDAGIGVKASYDSGIRRFFLQTASSGSANTLKIDDNSTGLGAGVGFLASQGSGSLLKLSDSVGQTATGVTYGGVDALLDVGAAKGIVQSSNEFSVNGVNFSLRKLGVATVQVSTDVNTAFDRVKKFVDEYNKLIDTLETKLNEKYNKNYQPLTDEQRESMSEDQVIKWEERAKTGLLSGSQEISRLLTNIRSDMIKPVVGLRDDLNTLTELGIGTAPYSRDGKLVIDETKLKEALQRDADSVMQLLFKTPDPATADETAKKEQTGLVNRLFGNIIDGMKGIISKAGTGNNASLYRSVQATIMLDFVTNQSSKSIIDESIQRYQKTIASLNDRFITTQERYYARFTAMERAIDRANSQSMWLSQQLGGMGGGY